MFWVFLLGFILHKNDFLLPLLQILIKALESIFGPVCSWGESTCLTIAALH